MLLVLGSVAFAGDEATSKAPVCVDGYVINHRELAVDGTRTSPPLYVEAVGAAGTYSATVGANGYFKFENLPAGDWNFMLKLPEGWQGIVPQAESAGVAETGVTTLKEQTSCYRIVFKIRRVFGVMVVKWEELLNATVQPGEGWEITATPVNDPFLKPQTAKTDAGGSVWFTLTAGKWVIRETLKTGWKPVTPSQVTVKLDQYAPAGALDPVIFKNLQPPCYTEIDVQKLGFAIDGQTQLGPLAGWKVTVSRADNTMVPITKVTDGFGKAHFGNLPPGVYVVTEQVLAGWKAMSDNPQTVTRKDCEKTSVDYPPVVFENKEIKGALTIHGRKLFQAWVPPYKGAVVGLPGWEITATLVGTGVMTTTVTDALGNYTFPEAQLKDAGIAFPGASVKVCEADRDNWIHVTPSCVTIKFPYPVPATYTGATVNFTNKQDPPPAGVSQASQVSVSGCRASAAVAKGQTLARLAAQYGTSVSAIVRANGIRNADVIYAGQTFCIP
jgi:hypothetical protein